MLRAWAKKITWFQAAEILGINDRHLRRIREGYEKFGYFSLLDKRRGRPSPKRVPVAVVEKVLALYPDLINSSKQKKHSSEGLMPWSKSLKSESTPPQKRVTARGSALELARDVKPSYSL